MFSFRTKYFVELFSLGLFVVSGLNAQTTANYIPSVIPPSPNSATLMKFSDVPVSPYTGAADITVPIYTIQARGVTVPISLDYHTGGIRVKEEAGWVGLGWALNAGGVISRTIMDQDDFGGTPYFTSNLPQLSGDLTDTHPPYSGTYLGKDEYDFYCNYLVNTSTGTEDFTNEFVTGTPAYDMEPDIYNYSFLGRSGKFILTRAGKAVLQKQDNIIIQFETNGNSFTITDESGNKYIFSDKEYSQTIGAATPISTWALSKIITQQNDTVKFTYLSNGYSSVAGDLNYFYNYFCSNAGPGQTQSAATLYLNQTLSTIDFSNGQIQFSFDASRKDVQNASKLNSIKIYSKNAAGALTYIKENDFYYSYFNSSHVNSSDSYEYTRLKLDSVKELSGTTSIPPYSFVYNNQSDQLPPKHSTGIDHWGFYNFSIGNSSLIPTTNIYFNPPGYVYQPQYFSYPYGANREPNPTYIPYASLQQITYPTGGKSVFEYEANDYDRAKSITGPNDFPDVSLVNVSLPETITNRGTTSGTITFSHITPILPSGSGTSNATLAVAFVYTTNGNFTYSNTTQKITFTITGPGLTTTIDGGNVGTGPGQVTCDPHGPVCTVTIPLTISSFGTYNWTAYIDPSVGSDYSMTRALFGWQETLTDYQTDNGLNIISTASGLRIKSITDFKDAYTPAKKKLYNYSYMQDKLGTGTPQKYSYGRLMSFPSYARYTFVPIPPPSGGTCYGLSLFSNSNTAITSVISGNIVGYDQVEEYNVDPISNTDIGKTVYKYYNISDSTLSYGGFRLPGVLNMGNSLNGSLLSKLEYAKTIGSYTLVAETDNFYHTANRIVYFSPKYQMPQSTQNGLCVPARCSNNACTPYDVSASFYPSIKSERILLDSTNEIVYDQLDATKFIVNKKYFFYDNPIHYLLTRSGTIDSKGNSLISQIKYPQDYIPSGQPKTSNTILDSLIGRNMVTEVIEKRDSLYYVGTTSGGKVTGAQLSKYKFLTAGTMGKDKQYRLDLAGPISDFQPYAVNVNVTSQDSRYRQMISFDSYDNTNNIAQYTAVDQVSVAIIWDYKNLYPIAQVKNAVLSNVAFTSFEADGNGNWNVASATRDVANFITGKQSYNLSSGSISKTGLVTGKVYLVTYWSRNGAYTITGGTVTSKTGRVVNGWTYYEQTVTTTSTTLTITGSGNIDELRLYPQGAQMTSYTYTPLVGETTMNDPNSEITYYTYDSLTRLKNVKDYQGNIVKNYQYNYAQSCSSCSIPMNTYAQTPTISYPVGVFSVAKKLLGNASTPAQYISLWNADANNHAIGTLAAGSDSMHFILTVNAGQTSPGYVIGCRYYQYDLPYTKLDAVRNGNGVYVDYGDGSGMFLGKDPNDSTSMVAAPNTVLISYHPGWGHPYTVYWIHNYPDSSLKTLTFYHNDATESLPLDNSFDPATSLKYVKNIRGNLPQNVPVLASSCFHFASANTVAGITNWSKINSISSWEMSTNDYINTCLNVAFAQDFMINNKNLKSITTIRDSYYHEGYEDTTFKISRLKINWNNYFTDLSSLIISDDHWNREDLSQLKKLNYVLIVAGNLHHSHDPTNNPLVPIPTTTIDNIINQVAGGAGQNVSNGVLNIMSGGTARSSNSDAGITQFKSKGWTVTVNGVIQ